MKNEDEVSLKCNTDEKRFLERLRQHPELLARFESILELAHSTDGPLKTADQVEELLIEKLRQLGNVSMNQWAQGSELRVSAELKAADDTVRSRKKNADVVVCLRVGERGGSGLAQCGAKLPAPLADAIGCQFWRTVTTVGAGVDGLWL
jgi:hypothetical protein